MYILATALLILGALFGATWGYILGYPVLKIMVYCFAGGFAGSMVGGILFTFLYLTADDHGGDENEKPRVLPDPGIDKKLPQPNKKPGETICTPTAQETVAETDTMKIKRLEQEIRSIKNRSTSNKGRI